MLDLETQGGEKEMGMTLGPGAREAKCGCQGPRVRVKQGRLNGKG